MLLLTHYLASMNNFRQVPLGLLNQLVGTTTSYVQILAIMSNRCTITSERKGK